MPIGPKRRLGGPRASRQLTDRQEFIRAFHQYVPQLPLEEHRVLTYYGVEGTGRTSLRKSTEAQSMSIPPRVELTAHPTGDAADGQQDRKPATRTAWSVGGLVEIGELLGME